jgi:hypothetical protein
MRLLQILQKHQQQPRLDLQDVRCPHLHARAVGIPFMRARKQGNKWNGVFRLHLN